MKPRTTIDPLEEETPFQVDENDIPPNLEDINLDEEGDTVAGMDNDLECVNDIELMMCMSQMMNTNKGP